MLASESFSALYLPFFFTGIYRRAVGIYDGDYSTQNNWRDYNGKEDLGWKFGRMRSEISRHLVETPALVRNNYDHYTQTLSCTLAHVMLCYLYTLHANQATDHRHPSHAETSLYSAHTWPLKTNSRKYPHYTFRP